MHGQYTIEKFLNSGGFGMTYLARDSLDRVVVIKECFPASFCCRNDTVVRARSRAQHKEFKSIVKHFVEEARRLSKLKHPNIVGVHQVFEDNETAYMALDYVDGQDLLDILDEGERDLTPDDIRSILIKILEAVSFIHDQNILHRDISPDNILLDTSDTPVLIDFGAAREKATKASRALSALLVVKDGYSPQEFYIAGSNQGPYSDLYALAASFYHLIAGDAPPNSQARLAAIAAKDPDPYKSIHTFTTAYDKAFLDAIDCALNVFPKDRIQTAQDWLTELDTEKRQKVALASAQIDKSTDRSISKLVDETNRVVLEEMKSAAAEAARQAERDAAAAAIKPEPKPLFDWDDDDDECEAAELEAAELEEEEEEEVENSGLFYDEESETSPNAPRRWVFKKSVSNKSARRFWGFGKPRSDTYGKAEP